MMQVLFVGDNEITSRIIKENIGTADFNQKTTIQEAIEFFLDDNDVDFLICQKTKDISTFFKYLVSIESQIPILVISEDLSSRVAFSQLNILGIINTFEIPSQIQTFCLKALGARGRAEAQIALKYQKIDISVLEKVLPCSIDLYLRLSDSKFIKIFKAESGYTFKDVLSFQDRKKLNAFYILNEDAEKFVIHFKNSVDQIADTVVKGGPQNIELSQSMHEVIVGLSRVLGFTLEIKEMSKQNVKFTVKNVAQNPEIFELFELLQDEKKQINKYEGVVLAHLACGLAAKMNWTSELTFQKLTLAAFFHDIALDLFVGAKWANYDDENFLNILSPTELEIYLSHPQKAAQILSVFSEIPPNVDQIILQHHERPDGSGFPLKLRAKDITPLSALFIVSHDLMRFLMRNKGKAGVKEFVDLNKDKFNISPFKSVLNTLVNLPQDDELMKFGLQ